MKVITNFYHLTVGNTAGRDGKYLLVAGLDFGTTYSGYAFSFVDDPEKIIANKNWGEDLGFMVREYKCLCEYKYWSLFRYLDKLKLLSINIAICSAIYTLCK